MQSLTKHVYVWYVRCIHSGTPSEHGVVHRDHITHCEVGIGCLSSCHMIDPTHNEERIVFCLQPIHPCAVGIKSIPACTQTRTDINL